MQESIQLVLDSAPFLLKGAWFTLQLSLGGMFFGLALGFMLAMMRLSRFLPLSLLSRFYVSIFRGTPLIAQLFMIYYGLPQFGIELDPMPAALIGLSLNTAAYTSETLRAAISSIEKGQWEAAASIGMTRWQTLYRVILPQAGRTALPPLGNSFIGLVKRHLAGSDHSGPRTFPPGAIGDFSHLGSFHYVSGGLTDLLDHGDPVISITKSSGSPC